MTVIDPTVVTTDEPPRRSGTRVLQRFVRQRLSLAAAVALIALVLVAIAAPIVSPASPTQQNLRNILADPFTAGHLLGTDELGRDVLTRLIYGARVSLLAAAQAVGVGMLLGVVPGLIAGYRGGRIDWFIMRCVDAMMAFPAIMLAITVVAALGPGLTNAMLAVGLIFAPRFARMARDASLGVRKETFVEAARSMGAPHRAVIWRHVVPQVLAPLIVMATVLAGQAMIIEAGLSFLGLGVTPPDASWGSMLTGAFQYNDRAPALIVWPGLCIVFTVICINLVGDGLKDSIGRENRKG